MTDSMKFYGLYHLRSKIVSATIGGVDCGDYLVASDGSITVPFGSDSDGVVTPLFVMLLDSPDYGDSAVTLKVTLSDASVVTITIPVTIGFTYTTQAQVLRPLAEAEVKTQTGPSLGMTRRTHMFSALLNNTRGISFGTNFNNLTAAQFTEADNATPLPDDIMFSGVYWGLLEDDYSFDSQLCWEITRPLPATIVAVSQFLETQERE